MNTQPNYELASKLKAAGFPQNVPYDELLQGPEVTQEQIALVDHGSELDVETVIWPSTDALIEQMPEVTQLTHWKKGEEKFEWIASVEVFYDDAGYQDIYGGGKTPKEALINLYLALHENK